jgi:chitin disaccharide deacetylase
MEAQISRMEHVGVFPTHLDGHGHVHKIPQVLAILPRIMRRHKIKAVRRTQNIYLHKRKRSFGSFYNWFVNPLVKRCGFTSDYFLMVACELSETDSNWLQESIKRLPEGITEIGIHPGTDEEWRRLETIPVLDDNGQSLVKEDIMLINYNQLINYYCVENKCC